MEYTEVITSLSIVKPPTDDLYTEIDRAQYTAALKKAPKDSDRYFSLGNLNFVCWFYLDGIAFFSYFDNGESKYYSCFVDSDGWIALPHYIYLNISKSFRHKTRHIDILKDFDNDRTPYGFRTYRDTTILYPDFDISARAIANDFFVGWHWRLRPNNR